MSNIRFRHASINDLQLLQHWDRQQHVIDCDPDDDWEWKKELNSNPEWREQLIAELDGEPIGFVQIIDPYQEETHYWGEVDQNLRAIDIWIGQKDNLNRGYGTEMMRLALNKCFTEKEVNGVLIDPLKSNTIAHRFYKRLGFHFVEERCFESSTCFVFFLSQSNWLKNQ